MGESPGDQDKAASSGPLWVDADWWREMLRTREPSTVSESAAPDLDGPTTPLPPVSAEPAPAAAPPRILKDGAGRPPIEAPAPVGPSPAAEEPVPAVPPPPATSADRVEPPAPAEGSRLASGKPAPPAVPRRRVGAEPEPLRQPRALHVPRVSPRSTVERGGAGAPPGSTGPPRTVLPPSPDASATVAREGRRQRMRAAAGRHVLDLALLLLAFVVVALVWLALGR